MLSAYRILLFLSSDPLLLKESKWYPFLATAQILPLSFMAYHRAQFSIQFCFYSTHSHSHTSLIDTQFPTVLFADGSQLYDSVPREQLDCLLSNMQSSIDDVKLWMTQNKLQLNDGKTEALLIDPQNYINKKLKKTSTLNQNRLKRYLFFEISPESRCDFWWQALHETTS